MRKILLIDSIPYLLSVLFGLMAYQVNNMVSYILDTPCITYEYEVLNSKKSKNIITEDLQVKIYNVNRKKGFKNLTFDLVYSSDVKDNIKEIYNPDLISVAPSATNVDDSFESHENKKINRYKIEKLQPQGEYLFRLTVRHHSYTEDYPKIYLSCEDDIWLTKSSNFEILIMKYQLQINLVLFIMWSLLILKYVRFIYKNNQNEN